MSMEHVIDLESLLAPISDDEPQGSDLRADRSPNSLYYAIKDARNNARAAERSAMFDEDVDLIAPWRQVADLAPKILRETSKDLEVCCWYTEALIRLHGLSGLRDGLHLIKKLIEDYWDGLYPEPDEDGIETKVAPLTGLNGDGGEGTLLAPLRNMPITLEEAGGEFSLWQYQQARDADRIVDEDEKAGRFDSLGYSLKTIDETVAATSVAQAVSIVESLEEALDLFKSAHALLRSHCDHEAPPSSNISNLLEELLRTARFIYKEKIEAAQAQQEATQAGGTDGGASDPDFPTTGASGNVNLATGPITDREDALKRLEKVAEYFRRYEPHSPIGPGLERLAAWGRMTVAELMMELLPEDSAKGIFSQLTGVKLDGSDTATYIAPPKAAAPQAANPPSQATPVAETEKNESSMGW